MSNTEPATAPETPRRKARGRRWALMLALPVVLVLGGGYFWVTGGRYVSTDNAYVQQDIVSLAPDVSGRILEVAAAENERVQAGQVLFRIDPEPFRIALAQAEAVLASARLQVEQRRAAYAQSQAELRAAEHDLEYRQHEYDRQARLSKNGYAAQSTMEEARNDLQTAQQTLAKARQGVTSALAALGGDPDIPTDRHPLVLEALAGRDKARLDLAHTEVRAPADGVVSQTSRLNVGQFMATGTPALSLVKSATTYVEANYKETDLTHMAPGQEVEVELDTYPGHALRARVASIGAGTGSEFSLLPAQNATGNWVKVVQRVPVRVRLSDAPPPGVTLRAGLSATVVVDTEHRRGLPGPVRSVLSALGLSAGTAYATDAAPGTTDAR
ncbi:HlyD family secretion protein [Azospirillum sp. ST 5-10]|uniref:HlyD family secretion protein n=1 Tax=unclassified Azospirillum TaxID=2630922 RepID=UPI003F4A32E3